jgi:hypothetical protein
MRQENQRILDGMRARQESIRQNDERALQAMRDDAAYYDKIRQRQYKIADQNVRTEIQQAQYNAAAEQADIARDAEVMSTFLSGIADFSATAQEAKDKAIEEEEAKTKKRIERLREENGPLDPASLSFGNALNMERIGIEQVRASIEEGRLAGVPEAILQQTAGDAVNNAVIYLQYDIKQKTSSLWPEARARWFAENAPEALGDVQATDQLLPEAWAQFKEEQGWNNFSVELLGQGLDVKKESDETFKSGVISRATDKIKAETITTATNAVMANPVGTELATSYRLVAAVSTHAEAQDWIKKQATAMDANGEFIFSDPQWKSTSLREDGKPYYTGDPKNPGTNEARGLEIANGREEKRREWNRNQNTTERQQYEEESKAWHRHIVVDGNDSPEDLAAAAKSFEDDVKGMPEWLRKLRGAGDPSKGGYNAGLITMAKDFQARGILYQDIVNKVFESDPKLGNELQESLNDQDPFMLNDNYKDKLEIVGKLNTKKDQYGNYPQSTVQSDDDSKKLQESYKQLVRAAVADGASIDDAASSAGRLIEQGHKDESSPFYRQYNPNTGFYEYPNLYTKTARQIAEHLDQADDQFRINLEKGKVNDLFSDPNMILTDVAFDQNIASMARPGYTFPARVDMIAERTKASHMEIMQQIAEAKGRPPIQPPPSLQIITEYPPAAKNLLNRFRSTNRDARGHGVGIAVVGTGWNEGLVPVTLREFYRASAERHGISPAENSAMGEIESNHNTARVNDKGMSVSYNGTSEGPMQINRSAHKPFFDQHNGNPSVEANIDYGTAYYANLKKQYNNDPIVAAMAYNGGPGYYNMWAAGQTPDWVKTEADRAEWQRITTEMVNHGKKFAKALYKYSGDPAILQHPLILRN